MTNPIVAATLARTAPDLAAPLSDVLSRSSFNGVVGADEAAALAARIGAAPARLPMLLVPFAQAYAFVPTSSFSVGAVGVGLSGALYFGANLEIPGQALCFSLHAEQAMTANAWIHGEQGLSAVAVSAAPCGHCRQFLNETTSASVLTVELADLPPTPLPALLPMAFGPADLGVRDALLRPRDNRLSLASPRADATTLAALEAANACYSPHTNSFAGVALRTQDGAIHPGRYAESAAHNPSLSPLAAALSRLILNGRRFDQIIEAVLVQAPGPVSQVEITQTVLHGVTRTPLTVVEARRA